MNLGKKIIALRKKEKISQEALADILGVTRQTMWTTHSLKPKGLREFLFQNIIVSKIDNTEKLVHKNTKNITIIIITVYFILLLSLIVLTIYFLTKKDFTKEYQTEFTCITKDKEVFNIAMEAENKRDNITNEEEYNDNLVNTEIYIVISEVYENNQTGVYERYYAGQSLSEIFESLNIIKKIIIEEQKARYH